MANNLSDVFERTSQFGYAEVTQNLKILEINILNEIKENWREVQEYMTNFMSYMGLDQMVAEEVALLPGTDEIFTLTRILRELESGNYDTIVMDCAPTASTLRLLTFTDSSAKKMNKLIAVERMILKLIRPAGKHFKNFKAIIPEDAMYNTFEKIIDDIGKLGDYLKNPEISTMRLVLNPDPIALAETKRTYIYMALFGFPVDGIFINKVFPEDCSTGYFSHLYETQQKYLETINNSFLNTSIFPVKYLDDSPTGTTSLLKLGTEVFKNHDPNSILSDVFVVLFEKNNDTNKVSLTLTLPGIDKSKLDIGRKDNELIIDTNVHTRVLSLPDTLANSEVESAKYADEKLVVIFSKQSSEPEQQYLESS